MVAKKGINRRDATESGELYRGFPSFFTSTGAYVTLMLASEDIKSVRVSELGARVPLFTLNGKAPGPRFVVVGDEGILREVADLAWNLPNLVAIHGALVLRTSQSDLGLDRARYVLRLGEGDTDAEAVLARVLRRMEARGMVPNVIAKAA